MTMQHMFFGPVDLPTPEPLRRIDRVLATRAGIRIVRPAGAPAHLSETGAGSAA